MNNLNYKYKRSKSILQHTDNLHIFLIKVIIIITKENPSQVYYNLLWKYVFSFGFEWYLFNWNESHNTNAKYIAVVIQADVSKNIWNFFRIQKIE